MNWFYAKDGQPAGPVDDAELDRLVQMGVVVDSTLVWHGELPDWLPYASARAPLPPGGIPANLPVLGQPLPTAPAIGPGQVQCSQCGRVLPEDELVRLDGRAVCAECKPLFLQRLREGDFSRARSVYAGFWIRVAAFVVDSVILIPAYLLYFMVMGFAVGLIVSSMAARRESSVTSFNGGGLIGAFYLGLFLMLCLYNAFCVSRFGGTPGKRICKLRIVTGEGQPLSFKHALARYLAALVSRLIVYVGYLFIVFDDQKRALHDLICDTRVIHDPMMLAPVTSTTIAAAPAESAFVNY